MKKLSILSVALTLICASAFATRIDFPIHTKTHSSQNLKVINICHLTDDDVNEILQGHHPELAVEFSAQTTLPVTFFLKGDLVNLVENDENVATIKIQQTFYVRGVQEGLILSTNLTEWKPFSEFVTGMISATLKIHDGIPSLTLGAETNKRS